MCKAIVIIIVSFSFGRGAGVEVFKILNAMIILETEAYLNAIIWDILYTLPRVYNSSSCVKYWNTFVGGTFI